MSTSSKSGPDCLEPEKICNCGRRCKVATSMTLKTLWTDESLDERVRSMVVGLMVSNDTMVAEIKRLENDLGSQKHERATYLDDRGIKYLSHIIVYRVTFRRATKKTSTPLLRALLNKKIPSTWIKFFHQLYVLFKINKGGSLRDGLEHIFELHAPIAKRNDSSSSSSSNNNNNDDDDDDDDDDKNNNFPFSFFSFLF
ncbi:hypothetical protein Cgig2_001672 [Carnegiea gigantea]|uniref:Uncharacterized protein n=1 Tax=Carnegiea gigantea TaxID=171969 RepID=A0A9Q1Q9D0_9CARY|nr:hypothetical protein Cgig2_001672 [Carnegiea gigantea]